MRSYESQTISDQFQDHSDFEDMINNPLTQLSWQQIKKEVHRISPQKIFMKLFTQRDQQNKSEPFFDQINRQTLLNFHIPQDKKLNKILQRCNPLWKKQIENDKQIFNEPYSFNFDAKCWFQETPIFKCLLQTPLTLFKRKYQFKIQQFQNASNSKEKIIQIQKTNNPCVFKDKPAAFFIGIALNMKNQNKIYQSLFFLNLACFVEPFNSKAWVQKIDLLKKIGFWTNAYVLSKTAFLFNGSMNFAEDYLLCAQKAYRPSYEIRGLLSSLKKPQLFQKVIVESSKYEIKYRKIWKGFILLNRYCKNFNYKPNIGYSLILLVKTLQYLGYVEHALNLLQLSIKKGLNKVEAFAYFIQLKLRMNKGCLTDNQINFLLQNIPNLTIQTRYRVPLMIIEATLPNQQFILLSKHLIKKSFDDANKYCKNGAGKQRAFRQIYFVIIRSLNLQPNSKFLKFYQNDQHLLFLQNRSQFIQGKTIKSYCFRDWKYYLHFSLGKYCSILEKVSQQSNQGRLTSQFIHVKRLKQKPLIVLNFWRKKIEDMPKSGQLWCQGGRIFAQLGQIQQATKCFQYAIHFTPQFGDSFIELLKIYLMTNNFKAINRVRKIFLTSEPHYGNVLSFLQYYPYFQGLTLKHSLNQIWQNAAIFIKESLYSRQYEQQHMLTAIKCYNEAFIYQKSSKIRQILFRSYELMENKNSKT